MSYSSEIKHVPEDNHRRKEAHKLAPLVLRYFGPIMMSVMTSFTMLLQVDGPKDLQSPICMSAKPKKLSQCCCDVAGL